MSNQVVLAILAEDAWERNAALAATLAHSTCSSCERKVLMKQEQLTAAVREGKRFVCTRCPQTLLTIRQMDLELLARPNNQ